MRDLVLRLAAFAALGTFGVWHWSGLVADPSGGRILLVVLVAAAGGVLLELSGRVRPVVASWAARVLVTAITLALSLGAAGLPLRLLGWRNWSELSDGLDRGMSGIPSVSWPYDGADDWVRLVILLGAPALITVAMALAFWPSRRNEAPLRAGALGVLLVLYGVAATEHDFGSNLLRGLLLFLLVGAWFWLPRLRRAEALAGVIAVVGAGLLALPLSAAADGDQAWVKYQSWNWFSGGKTSSFNWNHRYGPIDWPREGTTVLQVKSKEAHYWKAQALDRFDGFRWVRSSAYEGVAPGYELPLQRNPDWEVTARFTVRSLSSDLIIGLGTPQRVEGAGAVLGAADGAQRALGEPLQEGDTYTVRAYVPDPTRAQMKAAAPPAAIDYYSRYTAIELPGPGRSALDIATVPEGPGVQSVLMARNGGSGPALEADRAVRASAYGRMYGLARRLAAGQSTTYDVVKRIENHLQRSYRYTERPPSRPYPLSDFLFEDKAGYCQQFSGAMALMLRMNGIPARVTTGFTPGSYNRDTKEYRVRDLDAHSWVEVHFEEIGWVPFDPTPSVAPAQAQAGGSQATSAAARDSGASEEPSSGAAAVSDRAADADASAGGGPGGGGGVPVARAALVLLVAVLLAGGVLMRRRLAGRREQRGLGLESELAELRYALGRLGHTLAPGTTLLEIEQRLGRVAGPAASDYVEGLRQRRFAPRPSGAPGAGARRSLRRALTAHGGPLLRLRGFLALPPRALSRF